MRKSQSPPQIEEPLSSVSEKVEQDKSGVSEEESATSEIVPIGRGVFGDIYDQFRGKAKEAIDFLIKHKSGDLLGVFHRDGIGDIDLVWGDEKGGLKHIIDKHINNHTDFKDIDEAIAIIKDVIDNGEVVRNGKLRYKLKNGKEYTVTIRKDYNGVKKNWVVTAIDESRREIEKRITTNPTSTPQGVNEEGKPASSSDSSGSKDKKEVVENQDKDKNFGVAVTEADKALQKKIQDRANRYIRSLKRPKKDKVYKPLEEARKEFASNELALDRLTNIEPETIEEVAGSMFGPGGDIHLLYGDSGIGLSRKRGLMSHTGWGHKEMRNLLPLFRTAKNGGISIDKAGEMVQQNCRDLGINTGDNAMSGVNAILEVFSGVRTMSDLSNYVEKRRIEEARKIVEQMEEQERFYEEEYYERKRLDQELYEEQFLEEIKNISKTVDLNELDIKFAGEYVDNQIRIKNERRNKESVGSNRVLQTALPDKERRLEESTDRQGVSAIPNSEVHSDGTVVQGSSPRVGDDGKIYRKVSVGNSRNDKSIDTRPTRHTQVFKVVEKWVKENLGDEHYSVETARTGSIYLTARLGENSVDVRFSNHTKAVTGARRESDYDVLGKGNDVFFYPDGTVSCDIDISLNDMRSEAITKVIDNVRRYDSELLPRVKDFLKSGKVEIPENLCKDIVQLFGEDGLSSLKLRVRDNRIKNEEKRIAKIESGVTEDRAIIAESKERNRDLILSKLKEDSRVEEAKDGRYWFKGDDARFYLDKTGNILAIEYKPGISKLEKRIARESLTNEHSALYEEISKDLKSKGLLLDSTESELRVTEADKAVSEVREEISSIYEESRMYRSGEFSPASDAEIGEAVRIGKSLGVEVEVVNEPGSENAGYYDTKTGQVVVNSAKGGEGEAVKTVLHEVVGHKGLVAVLGEKADTFFGDVYDIIGATEQRKIYKLYKDSYGLNADFENISARDKRLIAQEYCATVSEGDIYNPTTLNKIRDFMVKAFRAVGINVKLSNRDVQMMLRKSRKYQERQAIVSEEVNKLPKIEISSMKGVSATEAVKVMEVYSDAQKYIDENGIKSALTIGRLFEIQKSEPGILGKAIGEQEAIHQDVLNEINGTFNEKLVNQINGAVDATPYKLGMPSGALLYSGVSDLPIEMMPSTLALKSSNEYKSNHQFDLSDIKDLPASIQRPIAVFDSEELNGKKIILTELTDKKGHNFVAVLGLNKISKNGRYINAINDIISLYPKDSVIRIGKWFDSTNNRGLGLKDDLLLWADTKKASQWLSNHSTDVNVVGLSSKRIANKIKSFDTPAIQGVKNDLLYRKKNKKSTSAVIEANKKKLHPTRGLVTTFADSTHALRKLQEGMWEDGTFSFCVGVGGVQRLRRACSALAQ